jgi:hypothetical protein
VPRADEIREMLRNLEEKDIAVAGNDGAAQDQVRARYTGFRAQVGEYVDWRDDQLDAGLPIIGRAYSSGETGQSVENYWTEYFLARGREAFERLNRAGDPLEQALVPALKAYARSLAVEESQFFAQLAAAPLAWAAGDLLRQRRDLDNEQVLLQVSWKALGDQSADVNEKIQSVDDQLLELFRDVTATLVAEQRGGIDKLEQLRPDPQATPSSVLALLIQIVKGIAMAVSTQTELLKRTTDEYMNTLVGWHRMLEGPAVLFTNMRESVRTYLEQRRLATATATFENAARDARELAGTCPTGGQRDDAGRFIERVVDEVNPIIDAFELSYKRFVEVHRAVFVGPVGPEAIEAMIQPDLRERDLGQLASFDLEARLQQLVDASAPTIFVDVEGFTEQDKEEIRSVFLIEWRKLGAGLVVAKNDQLTARVATVTRDFGSRILDRFSRSKGGEQ